VYSSIFGLVVITVERYVKIVHPVVYRNDSSPIGDCDDVEDHHIVRTCGDDIAV